MTVHEITSSVSSLVVAAALLFLGAQGAVQAKTKPAWENEVSSCQSTPKGPNKDKCIKRLVPRVKDVALHFPNHDTRWVNLFISWDDYLGIHDAAYDRAMSMVPVLQRANDILSQQGYSVQAWHSVAAYYDSLGPQWKRWSEDAKRNASGGER